VSEKEDAGSKVLVVPLSAAARARARACASLIEAAGHRVDLADDLKQAESILALGRHDVCLCAFPDAPAADPKVREFLAQAPDETPVVLAGVAAGPVSHEWIRCGAFLTVEDLLDSPLLDSAVRRAARRSCALSGAARFHEDPPDLRRRLGAGTAMQEVIRLIQRAAGSPSPVLVIGEAGSGKNMVARAVRETMASPRREGPYVRCPLDAVSDVLMHEELCGTASRPGVLERAHGGVLFLDGIVLLPRSLQAILLELMQHGPGAMIRRADDGAKAPADVKLVAGSLADLDQEVARGRLLEDLYYRLSVLPIRLPPLRERIQDIPILAGAAIDRCAARAGKTIVGLTPAASALLQRYHWPGNIRELTDRLERAVRDARGPALDVEDLGEIARLAQGGRAAPGGTLDVSLALDETLSLAQMGERLKGAVEVEAIRRALKVTGGNVTRAARLLQVSRIHIQKLMKRHGLREGQ
jgi:DNA-binding NtrC family response regulator